MNVKHLSSFSFEGGAAKAAARLHLELLKSGVDSSFYAQRISGLFENLYLASNSYCGEVLNRFRPHVDSAPLRLLTNRKNTPWSIGWLKNNLNWISSVNDQTVLHVHWIGAGFLRLEDLLPYKGRIVITAHDSWYFTAGCHIPYDCTEYINGCKECYQLGSYSKKLVEYSFKKKLESIKKLNPLVVVPSTSLMQNALSSVILRNCDVRCVPNGINTQIFKPCKNIDKLTFTIGFSSLHATRDYNKGFHLFVQALKIASSNLSEYDIVVEVVGATQEELQEFDIPFRVLGHGPVCNDKLLAKIYSGFNVMCVTSISESFCQVAAESISCGTPVLSFNTTGLKDIVVDGVTGYMAHCFDPADYAFKLKLMIEAHINGFDWSKITRNFAIEKFSSVHVAQTHLNIYNELL